MTGHVQPGDLPQGAEIDSVSGRREVDTPTELTVSTKLTQVDTGTGYWMPFVEVAFEAGDGTGGYLDRLELTLTPDEAQQLAADLWSLARHADGFLKRSRSDQP